MNELQTPRLKPPITAGDALTMATITLALAAVLLLHLLPALLAGLAVYALVQSAARLLRFSTLRGRRAEWLAVGLLAALVVTLLVLAGAGLVAFFRHGSYSLPVLLQRLADIVERSRGALPGWLLQYLPEDPDTLRQTFVAWLRSHTETLSTAGRSLGRGTAHVLVGMVIGALLVLRSSASGGERGPLAREIARHVKRLEHAFRRVVFAQVWIAAVNTALTALYLLVALPLAGIHLPLSKTLLALTFVFGLLPILGNLVSNTAVVLISLGHSLWLAVISLIYLVTIHKLEYFLNAHIIGSHIRARAWELLLAMVTMEAAFGLAGLIAAPIYYAYLKAELTERGWV